MTTLASLIAELNPSGIKSTQSLGGGCIANTQTVSLNDGTIYLVKSGVANAMLKAEANGLRELAKPNCIKVPMVYIQKDGYLVMEYLQPSAKPKQFFSVFGEQLALLHKTTEKQFGFYEDNYLGTTVQKNRNQANNWVEFFIQERLDYQVNLLKASNQADKSFFSTYETFRSKIPELLAIDEEAPSLIHGDLWSGNYVCSNSKPALIDPAVYYGHRELELSMTTLFGGFSAEFYAAYNAGYPLQPQWQDRVRLYTLYHLLNHFNLFGPGYYSECLALMKLYV